MLKSVSGSPQSKAYDDLADRVSGALDFMRACGLTFAHNAALGTTDFYTSHEALLLGYEQAFTRVIRPPATGTPPPATCCGSATAPGSPTTPISNTRAASRIRSGSNAGRR